LPGEDLARFRVTEADLAAGRITPDFIALLEFEMARTETYYRNARTAVRRLAAGRVGVMAALEVYRGIHAAIRRNGYDVFTRRASTTKPQKLGLALRAPLAVYLP
jgi:phytoene synthase